MKTTKRFIAVLALSLALYGTQALAQGVNNNPVDKQVLHPKTNVQGIAATPIKPSKPTVFLTGSGATNTTASRGLFGSVNSSTSQHDQTIEMAKDFTDACPGVILTLKQDTADYTVLLNFERNNHSQLMIAGADGSVLFTDTKVANLLTGSLGGTSVKAKVGKACEFITAHWDSVVTPAEHTQVSAVTPAVQTPVAAAPSVQPQPLTSAPQEEPLGDVARRLKAQKQMTDQTKVDVSN